MCLFQFHRFTLFLVLNVSLIYFTTFVTFVEAKRGAQSDEYRFYPYEREYGGIDEKYEKDLQELENLMKEISDDSLKSPELKENLNYEELESNERYKYEEPESVARPENLNEQINNSGVEHSEVIQTWDQTPSAVHEDYVRSQHVNRGGSQEQTHGRIRGENQARHHDGVRGESRGDIQGVSHESTRGEYQSRVKDATRVNQKDQKLSQRALESKLQAKSDRMNSQLNHDKFDKANVASLNRLAPSQKDKAKYTSDRYQSPETLSYSNYYLRQPSYKSRDPREARRDARLREHFENAFNNLFTALIEEPDNQIPGGSPSQGGQNDKNLTKESNTQRPDTQQLDTQQSDLQQQSPMTPTPDLTTPTSLNPPPTSTPQPSVQPSQCFNNTYCTPNNTTPQICPDGCVGRNGTDQNIVDWFKKTWNKLFGKKKNDDGPESLEIPANLLDDLSDEEAETLEDWLKYYDELEDAGVTSEQGVVNAAEDVERSKESAQTGESSDDKLIAEDVALSSKKDNPNFAGKKNSDPVPVEEGLKNFSHSDLQFLRQLISCMKKSSSEFTPPQTQKNVSHKQNHEQLKTKTHLQNSTILLNATQPHNSTQAQNSSRPADITHSNKYSKKGSTLLGSSTGNNSHSLNLTVPSDLQHQIFFKNFSQFVVECQPIVKNHSNADGQQTLSFNCTKKPINNTIDKFERNIHSKHESTNETMLENKLKYLAHVHHPVDMVGKQTAKTVDLKAIEEQIENAKYGELFNDDNDTVYDTSNGAEPFTSESSNISESPKPEITHENPTVSNKEQSKRSLNTFHDESDDPFAVDSDKNNDELTAQDLFTGYDELFGGNERKSRRKNRRKPEHKSNSSPHQDLSHVTTQTKSAIKNPRTEVSEKFTDFDEIQLKLTPEQEMDIHKFSQSLNERPQQFQFDINKYIAEQESKLEHKSLFKPAVNQEAPRKYFEFQGDESATDLKPLENQLQSVYSDHTNDQPLHDEESVNQDEEDDPNQEQAALGKRDINAKFEGVRNLVRENSALPAISYDVDTLHADSYRHQLEKSRKANDKFVDNYYFLGNGESGLKEQKTERENSKVEVHHEDLIPNSIDLDIDLKLSKEFEDLQFERDRILHRDIQETDASNAKRFDQDVFGDVR